MSLFPFFSFFLEPPHSAFNLYLSTKRVLWRSLVSSTSSRPMVKSSSPTACQKHLHSWSLLFHILFSSVLGWNYLSSFSSTWIAVVLCLPGSPFSFWSFISEELQDPSSQTSSIHNCSPVHPIQLFKRLCSTWCYGTHFKVKDGKLDACRNFGGLATPGYKT